MKTKKILLSIICGTLAVFLWSAIPALVKVSSQNLPDLAVMLYYRFALGSALLLPFFKSSLAAARGISFKMLVLLTITLTANYFVQGYAMQSMPVSWYLVIFALNPILAGFFMRAFKSTRSYLWLCLPLLGTFAFGYFSSGWSFQFWPMLALVLGMLTWVAYSVLAKKIQAVATDIQITTISTVLSLVGSGLVLLYIMMSSTEVNLAIPNGRYLSIIALGVSSPLAYFCFSYAIRYLPSFGLASQYLEPIFGLIIGFYFFGETFNFIQIVAAVMILVGVERACRAR